MIAKLGYGAALLLSLGLSLSTAQWGWPVKGAVSWWVYAVFGLFISCIFFIWVLGNHSRAADEKLAPKLVVSYDGSSSCRKEIIWKDRSQSPPVKGKGMSLRARVEPKGVSPIHSCQAKITKIEIQQNDEQYIDYGLHEPLALPWAVQADEFQPITIDKNIPMYFGFAISDERKQSFTIRTELYSLVSPLEYSEPGIYRLTIQVRSDEIPTIPFIVEVFWCGEWDKLRTSVVQ